MSGHSKWSTIKRQKAVNDNARGKVFSKHSRAITIAVKTGGGADPGTNYKLRVAIDAARADNMPKDTIERAVNKAGGDGVKLEEVLYEGFVAGGVNVIIEATTDNRNRTAQEIKFALERAGGSLGGPGSVAFNFETKGFILLSQAAATDDKMLEIIDMGVDEVEKGEDGVEIFVDPAELYEKKQELQDRGFTVMRAEIVKRPKLFADIQTKALASRVVAALETLEDIDDVLKVFDNANIPEELLSKLDDV